MTPEELTSKEDALFDSLERAENDTTFRGRLYRDGVPSPDVYLAQRVRVLFVFREPNLPEARGHDMRDEVRDVRFRPLSADGTRSERRLTCWWNWKAGMFAHAVAAALSREPWQKGLTRFQDDGWHHEVVNRFAYVQIKKVGGKGTARVDEIRWHAAKYRDILKAQLGWYEPHLVLGCGVGPHSPARLLAEHVLSTGTARQTNATGARWWEFSTGRPLAMLQLWHPAKRGARGDIYQDVWSSVRDVLSSVGLDPSSSAYSSG